MTLPHTTKRKQITVNKDDIEHGEKGNCMKCPLARALQRGFKDLAPAVYVTINYDRLIVYGDFSEPFNYINLVTTKPTPRQRLFMNNFDGGQPVKPFTFTLTYNAAAIKVK